MFRRYVIIIITDDLYLNKNTTRKCIINMYIKAINIIIKLENTKIDNFKNLPFYYLLFCTTSTIHFRGYIMYVRAQIVSRLTLTKISTKLISDFMRN